MSGDSVAQDQIRAFVERILRMKEERKAIDADIREIYAEAKGSGFDKTVLGKLVNYVEKRAADANAVMESESLFDLYLSAYDSATGRVGTARATHTHETEPQPTKAAGQGLAEPALKLGSSQPANTKSAPITEQQVAPQPASDLTVSSSLGQVAPISPVQDAKALTVEAAAAVELEPVQEVQILQPGPHYAATGEVVMENTPPEPVKWHPYAQCFPTVLGDNLKALEQDIHTAFGGVRDPIVKIGNLILDGRARYGIARSMLIDYPVVQYAGNDPLIDVIAWNLASRQGRMTQAQMASTAKALCKIEPDRADEIMAAFGLDEERQAAE